MLFDFLTLTPKEWEEHKDSYYSKVFGKLRGGQERIDYCLIVFCKGEIGGFLTCKELDVQTVYIQYGGVVPELRGTVYSASGVAAVTRHLSERYRFVRLRVDNSNASMLRVALKLGFLIEGLIHFNKNILLELNYERR
jgi:RimJ/RimL family protein N-acetyltransferase